MIEVCVKAGGHPIGQMVIERSSVSNSYSNNYDALNTYGIALRLHNIDVRPFVGVCNHRYGDEWPILLHEALGTIINSHGEEMRRK